MRRPVSAEVVMMGAWAKIWRASGSWVWRSSFWSGSRRSHLLAMKKRARPESKTCLARAKSGLVTPSWESKTKPTTSAWSMAFLVRSTEKNSREDLRFPGRLRPAVSMRVKAWFL